MFQVVLVGPDHRSATCLRAMLDGHGDFESLAWLFQTCIPFFLHHWAPLHKNALLATESILVDCAPVFSTKPCEQHAKLFIQMPFCYFVSFML